MFRDIIFFDNLTDALTATWTTFVVLGLMLVLLGFIVYLVPQLLLALVSGGLIGMGLL